MKLQKILSNFQKLHPKEIDLSLDRIKNLCEKLGNPQNDINCIQVCGTNGKGSTISFLHSILKEAKIKCNVYTSPHVRSINERFIYNDEIISDDELAELLKEVEDINDGQPLTYFEALTAAFFYGCRKYKDNIVLAEFGLFGRGDAVNILNKNLKELNNNTYDFVFYVAGVDIHHEDRLGKLKITDEGINKRDQIVIENFYSKNIPLCGVLGGGYNKSFEKLVELHSMLHKNCAEYF